MPRVPHGTSRFHEVLGVRSVRSNRVLDMYDAEQLQIAIDLFGTGCSECSTCVCGYEVVVEGGSGDGKRGFKGVRDEPFIHLNSIWGVTSA